jgi:radical SAM/Cys-rich protein
LSPIKFHESLQKHSIQLRSREIEIFQINLGKMCNLTCKHCHVEAGPNRKEIMTLDTLKTCLNLIDQHKFKTIDLTGGTPEVNPNFQWFINELGKRNLEILVRSNLVVLLEDSYKHLLDDIVKNKITMIVSFPHISHERTDKQRGKGVFDNLIQAIQLINKYGYGKDPNLKLHLVHNPVGAYLPANQSALEIEYKKTLLEKYNIVFNSLYCITNMPIGRYLNYLKSSGNYEDYMTELVNAFNPLAAQNAMCTNTISIGYDGQIYDCDFNQMLDLNVKAEYPNHIVNFDLKLLSTRDIVISEHCYGCTAGSGSSCQGSTA